MVHLNLVRLSHFKSILAKHRRKIGISRTGEADAKTGLNDSTKRLKIEPLWIFFNGNNMLLLLLLLWWWWWWLLLSSLLLLGGGGEQPSSRDLVDVKPSDWFLQDFIQVMACTDSAVLNSHLIQGFDTSLKEKGASALLVA